MPLGANRTDLNDTGTTYKNGFPVTLPLNVGNPITEPHNFGNPIPSSGTNENTVDWVPSPAHFGNDIGGSTPPPPANITFIAQTQTIQNQDSAPIDTTGATLIVAVIRANGSVGQMSDSANNTWTYGANIQSGSSSCQIRVGFVSLPATSATHTFHVINNESSCEIYVFKGNDAGWKQDSQAGGFEGATPFTLAGFTPGAAPSVILTGCGSNQAIVTGAIDEGFSTPLMQNLSVSPEVGGSSWLIQSAAAAVTPTWTLSSNSDWIAVISAFVSV